MLFVGFLINLLLYPGVGSLLVGASKEGNWQFGMSTIAALFIVSGYCLYAGLALLVVSWVWGLLTIYRYSKTVADDCSQE